ncbi:MAG: Homoserine dehydrogenase [Candidatus Accumulibacter regalis]|uniref:Homoserine dehydrogenase n=1 Tax=Accumulibacter regalis TaxID=522306 RepID=A0A011QJF3_ACCRE|nr:homoserine dehydrogenase [Accumulibacter sp.]EXI89175.1 MAG: Homoserine dehydrogenase [Candidatus Accumulibacter regalis]MBN8515495.1 homoserine dehydrogenase [Accumulibacter sp.]HRE71495.1 homoserine dehydrogenase [Accumulibacter sp.]HRE85374.1 homoserine dehydrogenase [Accumulibacter sp.]
MKPINVGLLGIGTVGGGTFSVLARNGEEIARRAGRPIQVSVVADRNLERTRRLTKDSCRVTDDAFAVVSDPDVDIVVELIGGDSVAKELVLQAIANGKHVVTANKALLAKHGNEIFAAAQKKGVMVAFEAAVAGGIPIIKALREGLTANRIEWIAGIINGTTNFILSEMRDKGLSFDVVLKEAQRLGYAEADPTFDVEGVDAAHKLSIMSAIAFGNSMSFDQAHIEGISQLDAADIRYAEQLGYRIKLLGITKRTSEGVELRVHPTLIPTRRLIANVEGAMNAVLVKGDAVGPTLYYGKGAGAEPTASAVIADLVDVTRMHTADPEHRVPHLAFQPDAMVDLPILPMADVITSYYLRLRVADRTGVLADVTRILADQEISIDAMIQREPAEGEEQTEIIMLTHQTRERNIDAAITRIASLDAVKGAIVRLRLEELL